jgi:hypothetical protein
MVGYSKTNPVLTRLLRFVTLYREARALGYPRLDAWFTARALL